MISKIISLHLFLINNRCAAIYRFTKFMLLQFTHCVHCGQFCSITVTAPPEKLFAAQLWWGPIFFKKIRFWPGNYKYNAWCKIAEEIFHCLTLGATLFLSLVVWVKTAVMWALCHVLRTWWTVAKAGISGRNHEWGFKLTQK